MRAEKEQSTKTVTATKLREVMVLPVTEDNQVVLISRQRPHGLTVEAPRRRILHSQDNIEAAEQLLASWGVEGRRLTHRDDLEEKPDGIIISAFEAQVAAIDVLNLSVMRQPHSSRMILPLEHARGMISWEKNGIIDPTTKFLLTHVHTNL